MNTTVNIMNLTDKMQVFYTDTICFDTDIESLKLLAGVVQTDMLNKLLNILFGFVIIGLIVFLIYNYFYLKYYKKFWIKLNTKMKILYMMVMYSYFGIYLYTMIFKFFIYHRTLDLVLFFISLLPIFYIIQIYFYDLYVEIDKKKKSDMEL